MSSCRSTIRRSLRRNPPRIPSQGLRPQRLPRPDSVRENSAGAAFFRTCLRVGGRERAAEHPAVEEPAGPSGGESVADFASAAPGAVLGDVINHDVQTLADTIAPPRDIASELRRSEPVTDLHRAIGINDKFLMIRDLFGGDGEAFDAALDALNGFGDLDDCMIYIAENYAWNANSDGAKLLMEPAGTQIRLTAWQNSISCRRRSAIWTTSRCAR